MLTDREFQLFRTLIREESGICLREGQRSFLQTRLSKRLKVKGMASFLRYYQFLTRAPERDQELLILLDLLTINATAFFRNPCQFELLKQVTLPEILARKAKTGQRTLRLWSAGCSTGQEPYAIAMVALEAVPFPRLWDITILASDISLTALESARKGVYPRAKLEDLDPYLSEVL